MNKGICRMEKKIVFLFTLILQLPCVAFSLPENINAGPLMTTQDAANNSVSNLNLTNHTGTSLVVYGVYLYGVASIEPTLNCQTDVNQNNGTQNQFMAGTAVAPVPFAAGQSIAIGQNYLYNMIYNWIYWWETQNGDPACKLPGCTWPGDNNTVWCLQVGAISPNSYYTSSPYQTNVVPFSWATTSIVDAYNYDLIPYDPNIPNDQDRVYSWIGPVTCNDQTLTCSTPAPQYQLVQP